MQEGKAEKDSLELGLTNANPMFVDDDQPHVLESGTQGYILLLLEESVINAASVMKLHPVGNDMTGKPLPKGYYHIVITTLQLTSGSAILYTRVD